MGLSHSHALGYFLGPVQITTFYAAGLASANYLMHAIPGEWGMCASDIAVSSGWVIRRQA